MKKVLALACCVLIAGAVHAASLSEGTQEIVVSGLFDPDAAFDSQLDLDIKYGKFIQDDLEIGAEGAVSDNDAISTYGIGGFAEYNFEQGTELVPYVGASVGWASVDPDHGDSADALYFGVLGGAKYFLAENVAILGNVQFEWATEDVYPEDNELSDTDLTLNLGMAFYIP